MTGQNTDAVQAFLSRISNDDDEEVYVALKTTVEEIENGQKLLRITCCDPSLSMKRLLKKEPHAVLITRKECQIAQL